MRDGFLRYERGIVYIDTIQHDSLTREQFHPTCADDVMDVVVTVGSYSSSRHLTPYYYGYVVLIYPLINT